ncbi:hypothetical protein CLV48_11255 [Cecembia rubra]|uniref:Uncharacterized protein n=1 Tax=Cecembia rubra TaxID=1485585 RepID=A0A2P8DWX8_9BACT|nr:hypothetical protein CLV48_11255 [Cecembia rubra]
MAIKVRKTFLLFKLQNSGYGNLDVIIAFNYGFTHP